MGPIEDLLKRNEDRYAKYWKAENVTENTGEKKE